MQGRDDLCAYSGGANASPERALWLAVLDQAIDDAVPTQRKDICGFEKMIREGANKWFDTHWFLMICNRAGLDPECVRPLIAGAIKRRSEFKKSYQLQHYRRAVA